MPREIAEDWRRLAAEWGTRPAPGAPANGDWWVWTEWYQAILDGTLDDARARIYGTVPAKVWKQGPEAANAYIAEKLAKRERPKPKRNLPSAFAYAPGPDGRIVATKVADVPAFPFPTSEADHRDRLAAAHELTARLLASLRDPRANLPRAAEYEAALVEYGGDLPPAIGEGSMLLAEASIRLLRGLFAADESQLPDGFKERLRGILLHHQSLRPYYPSVIAYYEDIRTGQLTAPLPLDAFEAVQRTVAEHTPSFFDPNVGPTLTPAPVPAPLPEAPPPVAAEASRLPPDPAADVEPGKARAFTFAGTMNAIYNAVLAGEKIHKGVEGWVKLANTIGNLVRPILENWPWR